MWRCSSGSSWSRYSRPRSTFSAPTKRAITSGPGSLIGRPPSGDVGLRVEGDTDPGGGELADDLAVGEDLCLRPHEASPCAHDLRLVSQALDLLCVHGADE